MSVLLLPMTLHAEAPFNFETTPGKLPKDVVPKSYDIQLKPNVDKLTFTGSETVVLDVRKPVKTIMLNANTLTIGSANLVGADGKVEQTAQVMIDAKEQTTVLTFAKEIAVGSHQVSLEFAGKINEAANGTLLCALSRRRQHREEADARYSDGIERCAADVSMLGCGGITFYESLLLFDPAKSSELTKQNIFGLIAHEMAHMWFGDLVTMAWWDNLWLNEGFASWMATKCSDHFNPQWQVWLRSNAHKQRAMTTDALSATHPIQQPVKTESEAESAFDEITYLKGESRRDAGLRGTHQNEWKTGLLRPARGDRGDRFLR
jgi:aminopeptidase N